MNLPNKLTISRILMTVIFLVVLFVEFPLHYTVALVLFVAASITDCLDGSIARKRGLITDFGKLMDPLADKVLICSAFIAFIEIGWMPAWMVVVVVARELAITGLRLLAASKNIVLAAEKQGKNKTITQIVAIVALLLLRSRRAAVRGEGLVQLVVLLLREHDRLGLSLAAQHLVLVEVHLHHLRRDGGARQGRVTLVSMR